MKINLSVILLLIFFSFASCIKEFIPHSEKYDNMLVVEGAITDRLGPYTVKLSMSGDVKEQSYYKPYLGCTVEIMDNVGNAEILTEISQGTYVTDSLGIQGVPGRKYKVKISTPDGKLYESKEEELKNGTSMQSVYGEIEYKNDPSLFYRREGYQFYVDVADTPENNACYLWLLESTYKFKVDLDLMPAYLRTCYRTQVIKEIYTLNTSQQSQQKGIRIPLNYEDNYTKALTIRYSLKVDQYTISESAYQYWDALRKMNVNNASLFTQQPYQIRGNLLNISNPSEPVLGYFMVAGKDEKRIFVDRPPIVFRFSECVLDISAPPSPPADACIDCRAEGFLQKPDFWIE